MRLIDIKRLFVQCCYDGDWDAYRKARKDDYCRVQLAWSIFTDGLCRDGTITQAQYERATF